MCDRVQGRIVGPKEVIQSEGLSPCRGCGVSLKARLLVALSATKPFSGKGAPLRDSTSPPNQKRQAKRERSKQASQR